MNSLLLIKTSLGALGANKGRSALTILGIVIGVAAIVLIMSLGAGAQTVITGQLGGLGADLVVVRPGRQPTGPSDFAQTLFANSLKARDVELLRQKTNVPDLIAAVPALIVPGSVTYGSYTSHPEVLGWSAQFMGDVFGVFPEEGEFFTQADIDAKASVVVIGSGVAEDLFGFNDPIGKNVKIGDRNFRVVGVLPSKGQVSLFDLNKLAIIPYTSAQTYLLGIDYYHEVMVRASSAAAVPHMVEDITLTLRAAHHITDPAKDDFFVVTQQGIVEQVQTILSALTAFLTMVVAISLVVGGIGVMNIMLVSVTERTREIGLRKAVGATDSDILRQFLTEAIFLTVAGGIAGVLIGSSLGFLITLALGSALGIEWTFTFPYVGALLAVGVSTLVGLVFGIYPARQASRKNPIEALRYE
ncbi:MAG: ABC transporter permease [Patescibacteria group bacterium]